MTAGVSWKNLSFFPIKPDENRRIMSISSMILDIAQAEQSGYTLRTFEAMGLKKKLVSTYRKVYSEDFYHPSNICVVSCRDWSVPTSFDAMSYIDLGDEINHKYTVEGWLKDVLYL